MANAAFNVGKQALIGNACAGVDLVAALFESTYSHDPDDVDLAAVVAGSTECSGTGYVRKLIDNANISTTVDHTGNVGGLVIADSSLSWTGLATGTDLVLVLCFRTGTDAATANTHIPLVALDTPAIITNGSNFTINFNSNGFVQI